MDKRIVIPETDLSVYPIGLGTVDAGLRWDGADADRIFDAYLDLGGNLIDSARVYSDWVKPEIARSERVVGDWLERSGKRNQVVLITKGGHPDMTVETPNLHNSRMTKADMEYDLNSSLKTLRTDYIDLYFYHRDDENQTVMQLIDVMEGFVKEGKIRYYGCSNWSTARMKEADAYCKSKGYRGFAANQALLNLGSGHMKPLDDDTMLSIDAEMYEYHRATPGNLAMPYMGVCSGFFHIYADKGEEAVKNSPYYTEENMKFARKLPQLMEKYNATVTQIVLGYFMQLDINCVPLYGPMVVENLADAAGTLDIKFDRGDYQL